MAYFDCSGKLVRKNSIWLRPNAKEIINIFLAKLKKVISTGLFSIA